METAPEGYIYKPISNSSREAASKYNIDNIKSITKNALQSYISNFLESQGCHRKLLKYFSTRGLNYICDKSLTTEQVNDPTKKQILLARMYNDIRERLPAILIVDTGFQYIPSGLGNAEAIKVVNGKVRIYFPVLAKINISLSIASNDQETTDFLQSMLFVMFGPLKNEAGGSRINGNSNGDPWEVRLPMIFSPGQNSGQTVDGDNKDQIWATTLDLELEYESKFFIEKEEKVSVDIKAVNNPNIPLRIIGPDKISINEKVKYRIEGLKCNYRVYIDNPNIAIFNPNSMVISPKRLGIFNIVVEDSSSLPNPVEAELNYIIGKKQIEVIL